MPAHARKSALGNINACPLQFKIECSEGQSAYHSPPTQSPQRKAWVGTIGSFVPLPIRPRPSKALSSTKFRSHQRARCTADADGSMMGDESRIPSQRTENRLMPYGRNIPFKTRVVANLLIIKEKRTFGDVKMPTRCLNSRRGSEDGAELEHRSWLLL